MRTNQQSSTQQWAVAAGHKETASAAAEILRTGGNAFDAAIAAILCACVTEPALASLGGGGFLLALPAGRNALIYDFFAQTPKRKQLAAETDFYPIEADFGTARQTFHIGLGSIATPGLIRGIFTLHRERCRLPIRQLAEPAIHLARDGVRINPFQHFITRIIAPIMQATPAASAIYGSPSDPAQLLREGDLHRQPDLADFIEALVREGDELFYGGMLGSRLIADTIQQGGHLRMDDLIHYQVIKRTPLIHRYRHNRVITNPLPSIGGVLIAFALGLLERQSFSPDQAHSEAYLRHLARTIQLTQQARAEQDKRLEEILNPKIAARYAELLSSHRLCTRGTTHISVADRDNNLASVTLSNGEGSGYVLPGTGCMLNNILGEEDLNPNGFHLWPENARIASMMSPTLVLRDNGDTIITGSGGSNRIRSTILQVISNLVDFAMPVEQAVTHPRIHFENGLLSYEPGIDPDTMASLMDEFPTQQAWPEKNLFFGGAHTLTRSADGRLAGMGDPRRGGVSIII